MRLVAATRDPERYGVADVAQYLTFGASPRASIHLIEGGRALDERGCDAIARRRERQARGLLSGGGGVDTVSDRCGDFVAGGSEMRA